MTKIMLVEDDKSLREIYGVRLLAEGYEIIAAGDGEEALALAIKERPALIVSDVMMPKISGFDMLDILRSTTETKNIQIIMMTALSSEEQRQRGEQLGADRYLVKSQVGIEDVVKTVHEVLGDKPTSSPPQSSPPAATAPPPPAQPLQPQTSSPPPPAPGSTQASTAEPQAAPTSSIPEPTAPFTGHRPATLGEKVIQPLHDNPRTTDVDVSELIEKEFANNIQKVEDVPSNPPPVSDQYLAEVPAQTSPAVAEPAQPVAPPPAMPQAQPPSAPLPPSAPPTDQFASAAGLPPAALPAPAAAPPPQDNTNTIPTDATGSATPTLPPQRPN